MKALISIVIIVLLLFGAWELWLQWDKYNTNKDLEQKQQESLVINPQQLPGVPFELEQSYQAAAKQGAAGLRAWLKANSEKINDPRKAWIELDYMVLIAHEDPVEAKKIFAYVKSRIPADSPVYQRVKELAKTYE